ncbi:polyprenyl diphosphate synthase [Streptomyces sp. NPDC004787]|uniref:polyprenyl diphosphate synthase n=1 Tax=Streptomyces sp. NPDC004787 TaxID=3154291 RepID=UPI0033B2C848
MSLIADNATESVTQPRAVRHLAVILDGNRRWAAQRGLSAAAGHVEGGKRVMDLLSWCESIPGLEVLTLWPLSTQNLGRSSEELDHLLDVITSTTAAISGASRWRIRYIGDLDRLPADRAGCLRAYADATQHLNRPMLNLAIAYSGRDEITRALHGLIRIHQRQGTIDELPQRVGIDEIGRYLDTAGQPDPDLVIRTSGEHRLSGFMPWQTAYSEFHFAAVCWPDFSEKDLRAALEVFESRERRYGR